MDNLTANTETSKLLKIEETLKRLDLKDRRTLYRWEKSGYLIPVRIGNSVRYKLSDINALLNGDAK